MSGCFLYAASISTVHICSTCVDLSILCRPLDAALLSADHPYALKMHYMDVLNSSKFVVGLFFLVHHFHHFISAFVCHIDCNTETCLAAQVLPLK